MIQVAVVGASGYAGGELLRLLDIHPEFSVAHAMAVSNAGNAITSVHPNLATYSDEVFAEVNLAALSELDLVFLALPHGESARIAKSLSNRVVDLGADFRLENASDWSSFYPGDWAGHWTYGLPEFNRSAIAQGTRIANPGCYATAIALAITPVARELDGPINVVAASGTSGAGRSSDVHLSASEIMGSMKAYKVGGVHQHTPEIEQSVRKFAGVDRTISFTPLLAPMPRGILATVHAQTSLTEPQLRAIFQEQYRDEAFVHLLPEGVQPSTAATLGSNSVLLQVRKDARAGNAVVTASLDNLVKGAAGQAVQNANLICGFPEGLGLNVNGTAP